MTTWDSCFLFLDSPRGGVEDLNYVRERNPWVRSIFVNIRDYSVGSWVTVLERARQNGITAGPWARTINADDSWAPQILDELIRVADLWRSPFLINCESELKGSGAAITSEIARKVGTRDAAISMEAWPFDNVDWRPVAHLPVLPQIFPAESPAARDPSGCKQRWHERGIRRVYFTFGTYGSQTPETYKLKAAYSLFPGDPLMATYSLEAWRPTDSGFDPTDGSEPPPTAAQLAPVYRQKVSELCREWEALEQGSTPGARLTIIRRIAETSDPQWYRSREAIRQELDDEGVPQ